MGTIVFGWEAMDEVGHLLAQTFGESESPNNLSEFGNQNKKVC
jgi:hypothetical protein